MVFLEFDETVEFLGARESETRTIHFVGQSEDDILDDVRKNFTLGQLSSPRSMTYEDAKALNLEFFEEAMLAVGEDHQKSFFLGLPRKPI